MPRTKRSKPTPLTEAADDLPIKLAQPARRALQRAGITRLEQLAALTETELLELHGMGPKAVEQLRSALFATGQAFANPVNGAAPTDESRIRTLLETWATATRLAKNNEILAHHAADALIFDVLPPLQYESAAAYRQSWEEWQPETTGPVLFELHQLHVTAGADTAFAHGLIHCGGTTPAGKEFQDWVRATFGLRKLAGQWHITHQHISMPLKSGKG